MTAQISDIYKHKKHEYNLVALSEPIGFDPKDYDLKPDMSCTACYRGYWCEYVVEEDELILDKLFLHNKDGCYPDFNGVSVSMPLKKKAFFETLGHRVYENINLLVPYTGKILLGDGFINKYYIHMGFQRAFAYEKIIELIFEEGLLMDEIDHSAEVKKMREKMNLEELLDRDNVEKFVEDSFSLDYKTKAWWL